MRLIDNDQEYLDFTIEGYEFENYEPYEEEYDYDAQWLITKFVYHNKNTIKEIKGSYLMTFELYDLINELNRLYNNKTNKIDTFFTEKYIKIECTKKDSITKLSIKIKDYLTNEKYKITKYIKDDELDKIITSLEELYLKYPERV